MLMTTSRLESGLICSATRADPYGEPRSTRWSTQDVPRFVHSSSERSRIRTRGRAGRHYAGSPISVSDRVMNSWLRSPPTTTFACGSRWRACCAVTGDALSDLLPRERRRAISDRSAACVLCQRGDDRLSESIGPWFDVGDYRDGLASRRHDREVGAGRSGMAPHFAVANVGITLDAETIRERHVTILGARDVGGGVEIGHRPQRLSVDERSVGKCLTKPSKFLGVRHYSR